MTSTLADPESADADESPSHSPWCLTVAHAREPAHIGAIALIGDGESIEIGRGSPAFGPEVLDDPRLSRRHARVECDGAGHLRIVDLESRNGTVVDGLVVQAAPIAVGSLIRAGSTILLVGRAPQSFARDHLAGLTGCGYAHAQIAAAIRQVAPRSAPVLLAGDTGTGKDHIAQLIHRESGRSGRFVVIECGAVPELLAGAELRGGPDPGSVGQLVLAAGGTLYLDGIEDAAPALQRGLLRVLDGASIPQVVGGEADLLDIRVIASTRRDIVDLSSIPSLRPDFLARLSRWVLRLTPLAARREDVPLLAAAIAEQIAGGARAIHPRFVVRLLRHPWPGNIHELEAVMEQAIVDADGALDLVAPERLGSGPEGLDGPVVRVASGRWIEVGGQRHALAKSPVLGRLLSALLARHAAAPGAPLSPPELLEAGWPGERVIREAAANRVYVAMNRLRKLGLRELLIHDVGGYLLRPEVRVIRVSP